MNNHKVIGAMDKQTRCKHYNQAMDIIAIKFKCCNQYYPCISCHEEHADHTAQVWPNDEWDTAAILCGACKKELTINDYMACGSTCTSCGASFNPGCSNHYHLYFDMQHHSADRC